METKKVCGNCEHFKKIPDRVDPELEQGYCNIDAQDRIDYDECDYPSKFKSREGK